MDLVLVIAWVVGGMACWFALSLLVGVLLGRVVVLADQLESGIPRRPPTEQAIPPPRPQVPRTENPPVGVAARQPESPAGIAV
jgi:hypothetical protein